MKKEYDFSQAKRGAVVNSGNKQKITIRLDGDIIEHFKKQAEEAGGGNYQTTINDTLREHIQGLAIGEMLKQAVKQAIHEEMKTAA
ncbi:MAG: BrnA antitoxin family protein [Mariprofundaceae bacterium]|nr:BrnA antitoxin family protein [Mariprofundaceae bacterium]